MEKRRGFLQVIVHSILREGDIIDNGVRYLSSPQLTERTDAYGEEFRAEIIIFINDAVGIQNWVTIFTPFDSNDTLFDVNIYCENSEAYLDICGIVKKKLKGKILECYRKGTIQEYRENQLQ